MTSGTNFAPITALEAVCALLSFRRRQPCRLHTPLPTFSWLDGALMTNRQSGAALDLRVAGFTYEALNDGDGEYGYEVDLPTGLKATKYFPTQDEALEAAASLVRPYISEKSWGDWHLETHVGTLVLEGYEITLDRCRTPHAILDWMLHIRKKTWVSPKDVDDFLAAIDSILNPRTTMPAPDGALSETEVKERVAKFRRPRS